MHIYNQIRIIGGSGIIGTTAWLWITCNNISKPLKHKNNLLNTLSIDEIIHQPFSGKSIDQTIMRGGW